MRRETGSEERRGRRQSAESSDYFASMTDLMLGLVFVFIIMLMGFVLNLRDSAPRTVAAATPAAKVVAAVPVSDSAELARREIMRDMARLLQNSLPVTIDEENGTLQLGDDILFPKGSADAYPAALPKLRLLADALDRVLPCYAVTPDQAPPARCAAKRQGRLDAVYIEGHTDTTPIHSARYHNNWELSAARAAITFKKLVEDEPVLGRLKNDKNEMLIGVSGYGEFRPVDPGKSEAAMQKNRRIELRFVMVPLNVAPYDRVANLVDLRRTP